MFEDDYNAAFQPDLSETVSLRLAGSPYYTVRLAVAKNPSIGEEACRVLLRDRYPEVATTVLFNPNCSGRALRDFLFETSHPNHAEIAEHCLLNREAMPSFWKACCAEDPNTPVYEYFTAGFVGAYWVICGFPDRKYPGVYGEIG